MRRLTFVGTIAIFCAAAAGCAAISGLDKLEKVECTDDCEGGAGDATVDGAGDARADQTGNEASQNDASDAGPNDSAPDTAADTSADSPADTATDAPSDGGADAPADAPPDVSSDCGATNTVTNCGACGNVCNTTTSQSSPACNGTKCLYGACNTGRSDCNSTVGANTDGCECQTPGCCSGNACQTTHDNGIGASFYDCVARDSFTQAEALGACTAYTSNVGQCQPATCLGSDGGPNGQVVCSSGLTTKDCVCWMFDGGDIGHLANPPDAGTTCYCPAGGGWPVWH